MRALAKASSWSAAVFLPVSVTRKISAWAAARRAERSSTCFRAEASSRLSASVLSCSFSNARLCSIAVASEIRRVSVVARPAASKFARREVSSRSRASAVSRCCWSARSAACFCSAAAAVAFAA